MSDKKFYQEVCKTMEYKEKIKQLKKENQKFQQKIDRANEILNEGSFEYDNCPDSVINEIIELKRILGDKE